jgi:N-acyl homoserine lactone hydrolase
MNGHPGNGRRQDGRVPPPPTITALLVAELLVEGERWPVYVHVIDHPDARVLVDTGMRELRPEVADLDPRLVPLSEQAFDLADVDLVVNTHLHFDHCGGNHLFAGRPIYVQRLELEDARSEDDYTIREWVEAPGVPTSRSTASSSCCPGSASSRRRATRAVCRWSSSRRAGLRSSSAATWPFASASSMSRAPRGQLRVRALEPELVWLAHEHEPWRPRTV